MISPIAPLDNNNSENGIAFLEARNRISGGLGLARRPVDYFQRAARFEAAMDDCENHRPEKRAVVLVKRAVDEDRSRAAGQKV